jgi:hypothetical protein
MYRTVWLTDSHAIGASDYRSDPVNTGHYVSGSLTNLLSDNRDVGLQVGPRHYYSIITWCFSYWSSYRSEACCIGLRRSRTPIQQTENLWLGQYEKHHVIIPLLINQTNISRDLSLQLSKCLADSNLVVIGLTGIGPIRKISVLDRFLPYWPNESFYFVLTDLII